MKRPRDQETVGRSTIVQVAKFHGQVFQTLQTLRQRLQKITTQLAEIDKQIEALIKSSGVILASNYRTNTLGYFKGLNENPENAEITYLLSCNTDCLSWPEEFRPQILNFYLLTVKLAGDALSMISVPPLSEKSASENWLDGIDFTLFI